VHTHVFARLARSVARANGMPTTRQAFVPQPVVGRSTEELRAYVDGEDPVNGGPFMQHVIEGLTNPLQDEDLAGMSFDRSAPRLLDPDTEESLQQRFAEEVPASRVLVNGPATHGCIGVGNGLTPSLTLGCGTFGGNSTTDNVTYTNLLNVKRLARPV